MNNIHPYASLFRLASSQSSPEEATSSSQGYSSERRQLVQSQATPAYARRAAFHSDFGAFVREPHSCHSTRPNRLTVFPQNSLLPSRATFTDESFLRQFTVGSRPDQLFLGFSRPERGECSRHIGPLAVAHFRLFQLTNGVLHPGESGRRHRDRALPHLHKATLAMSCTANPVYCIGNVR